MIDFVSKPTSKSTIIVAVSGDLTGADRDYFFDCVGDYVDAGYTNVIIECHKLGYLNSSGMAALLSARQRAAKNGARIFLTHLSSNLAELLEMTRLARLLSVYSTTEDAIATIESELACAN